MDYAEFLTVTSVFTSYSCGAQKVSRQTSGSQQKQERDTCAECRCACAYRGTAGRRAFSRFIAFRRASRSRSAAAAATAAGDESNK